MTDSGRAPGVALLCIAAALAFVLLRAPYLELPLERDEGEYAYIAQQMLTNGAVPYRDALNQKTPGAFAVYALALAIGGESLAAIRWLGFIWMALTALAVAAYGLRLYGPIGAATAGLAFTVLSASPVFLGPSLNTEMLLVLPMLGTMYFTDRALEEKRLSHFAAAGALVTITFGFKQLALPLLLVVVGSALLGGGGRGAPATRRLRAVAGVAAGMAAVAVPVLITFAAFGALGIFLDDVFTSNLSYGSQVSVATGLEKLGAQLRLQAPVCVSVWLLAGVALARLRSPGEEGRGRVGRPLLAAWLFFAFAGASLGLHYRPHYFLIVLAPLCLLAADTVAWLIGRLHHRIPILAACALTVVLLLGPGGSRAGLAAWSKTGAELSRELYGLNPFPESATIGRLIREGSATGETVFVWGSEPQIFFHADRRSATRYILTYPLTRGDSRSAMRQREAWREVEESRPRYVVLVRIPTSHLAAPGAADYALRKTAELLEEGHELEGIWILRQHEGLYDARLDEAARQYPHLRSTRHGLGPAILLYRRTDGDPRPQPPEGTPGDEGRLDDTSTPGTAGVPPPQ